MIGDVNCFYPKEAGEPFEINVMIAEKAFLRQGFASEALELMMSWIYDYKKQGKFVAKILMQNESSIKLFSKLGFRKTREVKAFNEVHYEIDLDGETRKEKMNYTILNEI